MPQTVFVINGPNLNLLGLREPNVYGRDTLDDVRMRVERRAADLGLVADFRQSNSEGELVGWVQEARSGAAGIIINPAAYTHTSIALLDALLAADKPCIEVHLSNIHSREDFRRHSYISRAASGVICGLGLFGYELALQALAEIIRKKAQADV